MILVALSAALLAALSGFIVGRVTAGSRYRYQISALNEKHNRNLDGLVAVIENLRRDICLIRDPGVFHRAIVRASAQLIRCSTDAESVGDAEFAQALREASAGILSFLPPSPEVCREIVRREVAHA